MVTSPALSEKTEPLELYLIVSKSIVAKLEVKALESDEVCASK